MATITAPQARHWRTRSIRFLSNQQKWAPYLFIAPFFITFAIFTLYPLLRAVLMAFQESLGYSNEWEWVGLANFQEALTRDPRLIIALKNVFWYTVGSIVTQLPIAFGLALLLTSPRLKGRGLLRTLFYIPVALPGVTIGVIGAWFFNTNRGFANELLLALGGAERIQWGLYPQYILPMMLTLAFWQYVGYHTVFLIAGLSGIDSSIIEAAIVDGANTWQRIRYIILPLLKPVIAYMCITMTAGSLLIYEVAIVLFAGGSGPAGQGWFLLPYITWLAFDQFRLGYATAIGWLVFFIAIAITLIQLKLFRFGEVD
jgi:ABC-type sugar transport system permease subunit